MNDSPAGDEFSPGPNAKSMKFATRVESDSDSVIIRWLPGEIFSSALRLRIVQFGLRADRHVVAQSGRRPVPCSVHPFRSRDASEKNRISPSVLPVRTYVRARNRVSACVRISFDGGSNGRRLCSSRALVEGKLRFSAKCRAGSWVVVEFADVIVAV